MGALFLIEQRYFIAKYVRDTLELFPFYPCISSGAFFTQQIHVTSASTYMSQSQNVHSWTDYGQNRQNLGLICSGNVSFMAWLLVPDRQHP